MPKFKFARKGLFSDQPGQGYVEVKAAGDVKDVSDHVARRGAERGWGEVVSDEVERKAEVGRDDVEHGESDGGEAEKKAEQESAEEKAETSRYGQRRGRRPVRSKKG